MKTSESIKEIAGAISKLQGDMGFAKKDKKNTFYKSSYADLASVWEALREPLSNNGLAIVQDAVKLPEGISVITRVIHTSGEWIEFGPLVIPLSKNDAHSVGSAISYSKRYGLGAALGIVAEEDDDGNKAQKNAPTKETPLSSEQIENFINSFGDDLILDTVRAYLAAYSQHFDIPIWKAVKLYIPKRNKFIEDIMKWDENNYSNKDGVNEQK